MWCGATLCKSMYPRIPAHFYGRLRTTQGWFSEEK